MRNFGFAGYDQVVSVGTNGKMSEISAAMGLTNLESIDDFIDINRRNYNLYRKYFSKFGGIKLIDYEENEKYNYQYIVIEVDKEETGISRDNLVKILHAENILARKYFYPGCHQMEPYSMNASSSDERLLETELLSQRVISLPNGTGIGPEEIKTIYELINFAKTNNYMINEQLIGIEGQ
jgi:dTDP-4-amino-4,6-dideoxygalactose transaminase